MIDAYGTWDITLSLYRLSKKAKKRSQKTIDAYGTWDITLTLALLR